jgi:hypothetical protein
MTRVEAAPRQSTAAPWVLALRVTSLLHAAILLWQGLTAGRMLSGADALGQHGIGAITTHVLAAATLASAVLVWRATSGPLWPTVLSAYAFLISFVQAKLGSDGNMELHVPIAITLTIAAAAVVGWAWTSRVDGRTAR